MSLRSLNHTLLTAAMLVPAAWIGAASAHDQIGELGGKAGATDIWEAQCSGGSAYLAVQVRDALPRKAPKLSVQVHKDRLAANATDPQDGDEGYSPEIRVYGGDGIYTVLVDKTGKAAENYFLEYHCESGSNPPQHTGTTITPYQNQ